jgi:tetratricopeptide (TPR) repeat protein
VTRIVTSTVGLAQSEPDVDGAIASFHRVLQIAPRHALARYNLALVLRRADRMCEAIDELQRALDVAKATGQLAKTDALDADVLAGRAPVRAVLYMGALVATRRNPVIRVRLVDEGSGGSGSGLYAPEVLA